MEKKRIESERISDVAMLVGGLAHEIKNPLSTMSVNLQLLKEEIQDDDTDKGRRILKKIQVLQKESSRLEEILNDFLRFTKEQELELEEHDINTVVDEVLDFIAPEAQLQSIKILKLYDPSLPKCFIDNNLVKQAILNILINAQEAMPEGGILTVKTSLNERTIPCTRQHTPSLVKSIRLRRIEGLAFYPAIQIDFADTGVGIPSDKINKIFQPYFSTKKTGTGLGLPTAKRIIERHKGALTVHSKEGEGTKFSIRLPLISKYVRKRVGAT
ncbi:MAG: two-component sensor histidine kinase [Planctomycetes bacterium]|nr:two-component sensor histidine kinase [Planctomycetota bacterium]